MSVSRDFELIEKFRELERVGSAKVTILSDQVSQIVVADLIAKYKACKARGDKYTEHFRMVLSFYLEPDEMAEMESL